MAPNNIAPPFPLLSVSSRRKGSSAAFQGRVHSLVKPTTFRPATVQHLLLVDRRRVADALSKESQQLHPIIVDLRSCLVSCADSTPVRFDRTRLLECWTTAWAPQPHIAGGPGYRRARASLNAAAHRVTPLLRRMLQPPGTGPVWAIIGVAEGAPVVGETSDHQRSRFITCKILKTADRQVATDQPRPSWSQTANFAKHRHIPRN